MIIGDRLRALREEKKLSQGDIEKRTGLGRPYISRAENNHSVPNIETLEKWARALEVLVYQLFYDGDEPPKLPILSKRNSSDEIAFLRPALGPSINEMPHFAWLRLKPMQPFLNLAVRLRQSVVLPQVFRPRFDGKRFEVERRMFGVVINAPPRRAIAPAHA